MIIDFFKELESKDWVYLTGIILSFVVGVLSLFINIKNRRNAIREHLYKEQYIFFYKISKEFSYTLDTFIDIQIETKLTDKLSNKINMHFAEIGNILDTYDFIIPEDLFKQVYATNKSLYALFKTSKENKITDADMALCYDIFFNMQDDARMFFGIEKLSLENRNMVKSNQRIS